MIKYVTIPILYRCRTFNLTTSAIPRSCEAFYSSDSALAFYDSGMQPDVVEILDDALLAIHSNASDNHDKCVQLIENYLCHYYFPACHTDNNDILPVCSSSCNILLNNQVCSELLMDTLSYIAEKNITLLPDGDSCAVTHCFLSEPNKPAVNESCLGIEGWKYIIAM